MGGWKLSITYRQDVLAWKCSPVNSKECGVSQQHLSSVFILADWQQCDLRSLLTSHSLFSQLCKDEGYFLLSYMLQEMLIRTVMVFSNGLSLWGSRVTRREKLQSSETWDESGVPWGGGGSSGRSMQCRPRSSAPQILLSISLKACPTYRRIPWSLATCRGWQEAQLFS